MPHNSEDIGKNQFLRAFLESADKNESEKLRNRIKIRKPKDTGRSNKLYPTIICKAPFRACHLVFPGPDSTRVIWSSRAHWIPGPHHFVTPVTSLSRALPKWFKMVKNVTK
jgi:hypothetical protein